MRLLSLSSLAAITAPLLQACGGGGDPGNGNGNGGSAGGDGASGPPTAGDATREAILAQVAARAAELRASSLTPAAQATAMAATMSSMPGYTDVGTHAGALSAWGRFQDGRAHIVSFDPGVTTEAQAQAEAQEHAEARATRLAHEVRADVEVPGAPQATVLHSFGPRYTEGTALVTKLSSWLRAKGYAMSSGDAGDAHLPRMRTLRGDGFFSINTHGGAWGRVQRDPEPLLGFRRSNDSPQFYSITSSTTYDPQLEQTPAMVDDLDNWRLVYVTASTGDVDANGRPVMQTFYGMTLNFVLKYWRFADNSIVLINACSSARTEENWASHFIGAVHAVGAAAYAGWNETVTPGAVRRASEYFVDRLLGANVAAPVQLPPQRAFSWDKVFERMQARGVDTDRTTGAKFLVMPKPGVRAVQALCPGLFQCEVQEDADELVLKGDFGSKRGVVLVAGVEQSVIEWTAQTIRVRLPRTGAQSFGTVQVKVGPLESNIRHLSSWNAEIDVVYQGPDEPNLRIDGKAHMRFRADVGKLRDSPDEMAREVVSYAIAARGSRYVATASGTAPGGATWSGTANYLWGHGDEELPLSFGAYARFDPAAGRVDVAPVPGIGGGAILPFTASSSGMSSKFLIPQFLLLDGLTTFKPPGAPDIFAMPLQAFGTTLSSSFAIIGRRCAELPTEVAQLRTASADGAPAANAVI